MQIKRKLTVFLGFFANCRNVSLCDRLSVALGETGRIKKFTLLVLAIQGYKIEMLHGSLLPRSCARFANAD